MVLCNMTKRSGDRNNSKSVTSKKICDSRNVSTIDCKSIKESDQIAHKTGLTKSESAPSLIDSDDIRAYATLRHSHFLIVDTVLKETKIDPLIEAILPFSLNKIYQKFVNSDSYVDKFRAKNEFYRGIGLLGVGIERRIYDRRKSLQESLKRRCRLRPNPKPRKQFDGTIINRALNKNRSKQNLLDAAANEASQLIDGKPKLNLFTIGGEESKKVDISNTHRKRSVTRRAAAQKLEVSKKSFKVESQPGSDNDANSEDIQSKSISRTKCQLKTSQLHFKNRYNGDGGIKSRSGRDDQFMEIEDSDSSSVVEVFPSAPIDREISKGGAGRQGQKVLSLLDKLRLGLQCTVMQTENDIVIQHLTVEDLTTLRSRLQGVATFKNIEAEYDREGVETARATIDRRMLGVRIDGGARLKGESRREGERAALGSSSGLWVRPKVRTVKKVRKLYTQGTSTPNILARVQGAGESQRPPGRQKPLPGSANIDSQSSSSAHASAPPAASFYPQLSVPHHHPVVVADSVDLTTIAMAETQTSTAEHAVEATSTAPKTHLSMETSSSMTMTATTSTSTPTSCAATAMSASQLLMLKKSAASSSFEPVIPHKLAPINAIHCSHILQPFKKSAHASSPPSNLELDDEEPEFELTPSLIAQAARTEPTPNTTASPLSLPLVTTGNNVPRPVNLGSLPSSVPLSSSSSRPPLAPNGPPPPPLASNITGGSVPPRDQNTQTQSPNLKIKHRKWTHNFLASNHLNIREVLCSGASADRGTVVSTNPVSVAARTASPLTVPTAVVGPITQKAAVLPVAAPNKGSSVVLKSLLVGSHSRGELCAVNKAAGGWTSGYVAANSSGSQDSKIKWQVGGSVVPSQPAFVALVGRDSKALELGNKRDDK